MKIRVSRLKKLINEALREEGDVMFGSRDDIDHSISAMDPDTVAEHDYVDEDTGEIYLEKDEPARNSLLHPQFKKDREARRRDREEQWAREEETDTESWELDRQEAQSAYEIAVSNFAENSKDYLRDNPGVDPSGVAADLADSFFFQYPDWNDWSKFLGLSKTDIKSYVTDMVYEAMS